MLGTFDKLAHKGMGVKYLAIIKIPAWEATCPVHGQKQVVHFLIGDLLFMLHGIYALEQGALPEKKSAFPQRH
jgi:hypothetical protein